MKLFRVELDNDTFLGSDDAFSAGWSLQVHSPLLDEWTPGLAGWIGRFPSLRDDGPGGRIVRWSWGVTQLIVTPQDVAIAAPQLDDTPWAGLLGGYVSWAAYDDQRLAALQAYVGCLGPCSQAEAVQKFVHNDLHLGARPEGWSNQLNGGVLFNLNYEYRRKVWTRDAPKGTRGWATDASIGAQAGVGSFATYAEAWVEYRFGWGIPPGFNKLSDPPALGIALDPVYSGAHAPSDRRAWRPHFFVVARLRSIERFVVTEGGTTQNGGGHPRVDSIPGARQLIVGAHVAKAPFALQLTYYRYLDSNVARAIPSKLDWVNVSFDRRF
jgi:hypothetical protein